MVEPREPVTVSALVYLMKTSLEEAYSQIWIEGEMTNFVRHRSGHCYFSLKDSQAQLRCAFFKFKAQYCQVPLADGMKVKALGNVSIYPDRGELQFIVDVVRELGAGDLHRQFELLKERLMSAGYFEQQYKKQLPEFPSRVGIITSATGAVIQDIEQTFARRAPWVQLYLLPVRVQGQGAAEEIASAIGAWNTRAGEGGDLPPVDMLIVGRGGGSLEDLWAFNEEIVAKAIFESELPIISAVGHETDFTIADFVADVRAATPTAAAELSIVDSGSLMARLTHIQTKIRQALVQSYAECSLQLRFFERGIFSDSADKILITYTQLLESNEDRLKDGAEASINEQQQRLNTLALELRCVHPRQMIPLLEKELSDREGLWAHLPQENIAQLEQRLQDVGTLLRALGPESVLQRGYALVSSAEGIVRDPEEIVSGERLTIILAKGELIAHAE